MREGNKRKRDWIDLKTNEKKQRVFYNRLGYNQNQAKQALATRIAGQLKDLGVNPVKAQMIRDFGFGAKFTKVAVKAIAEQ